MFGGLPPCLTPLIAIYRPNCSTVMFSPRKKTENKETSTIMLLLYDSAAVPTPVARDVWSFNSTATRCGQDTQKQGLQKGHHVWGLFNTAADRWTCDAAWADTAVLLLCTWQVRLKYLTSGMPLSGCALPVRFHCKLICERLTVHHRDELCSTWGCGVTY